MEIFEKVHTKLSSHQNEASRSNEVMQIPTSSDPKYQDSDCEPERYVRFFFQDLKLSEVSQIKNRDIIQADASSLKQSHFAIWSTYFSIQGLK